MLAFHITVALAAFVWGAVFIIAAFQRGLTKTERWCSAATAGLLMLSGVNLLLTLIPLAI